MQQLALRIGGVHRLDKGEVAVEDQGGVVVSQVCLDWMVSPLLHHSPQALGKLLAGVAIVRQLIHEGSLQVVHLHASTSSCRFSLQAGKARGAAEPGVRGF